MFHPYINIINAQRNVLASSSPRRKQILENIGLKFEIIPSTFEENLDKSNYSPSEYVLETARLKTEEVAQRLISQGNAPDLIIGADTVVSQDGSIIEKPKDKADAHRILSHLSGNVHKVYTGVVLFASAQSGVMKSAPTVLDSKYRYSSFVESSDVFMSELSDDVIQHYIETGEPLDKAGAYGIQAIGGTLVEKINGDYFNIMGFPLPRFARELANIYGAQNR